MRVLRLVVSLCLMTAALVAASGPGKHGFHTDGRPWLWPAGAQDLSRDERAGRLRRDLDGERAFQWSLDRGEADLLFVASESKMDPSLVTSEVRIRVFYANGDTQDFPSRAVTGMDRTLGGPEGRVPDGLIVEAILPADGNVKRIQVIDHQGQIAWDAAIKESMFHAASKKFAPDSTKDYLPDAVYKVRVNADMPGFGQIDSRAEARRERQNARIIAGIYPPYELAIKAFKPVP